MSAFLHPALLWFLPLAAIPIILHLLTLHRLKTVELSTFRFLFDSYVQQRRRMRFLEALLAMLRTLFLLVLVAMISRPVVQKWSSLFGAEKGTAGREVILLMDCSASMEAKTAGLSAFDRAKKAAHAVVDRLGRDDRVTLIRLTNHPEELFSRFTTDAKDIQKRIDDLKTAPARGNVYAALEHLFGPQSSHRGNPFVYLFTDCQATGWREVRSEEVDRLIPEGTPFVVVNVGSRDALPNRAVIGDVPQQGRAIAGLPLVLQPRVVNFSKSEKADLTLSLFLEGEEIPLKPLSLKPGETATPQVSYLPSKPGLLRGRFVIHAATPDRFPDDDQYFFSLFVEDRVKVLVIGNSTADDPEVSESRYLATALSSQADSGAADARPAAQEAAKISRSLEVSELAEAALTPESLKDASVVVLANCGGLDVTKLGMLRDYVQQGGGLVIFPGDKVNADLYNTTFFPVPGPQEEQLTPARLAAPVGDVNNAQTFDRLSINLRHPALTVFDDPESSTHPFASVRVYRHFPIQLPRKRGAVRELAWFSNGEPALVENRFGDGRVLLASFPAHTRWTNLPTKPDFVPLVLRLVSHVEHYPEVEVSSAVSAGNAADVSVSNTWSPAEATVRGPQGSAQSVPLERAGARLFGAFKHTGQCGHYTVDVRGNQGARPRAATLGFAVNLAPEEADFTLLDEKGLRERLPTARLTYVDASAEAQLDHGSLGQGHEIWQYLIWGLFLIIGVEFFFATLSGRRRDTEDAPGVGERILQMTPGAWVGRMTGAGSQEPGGG
jgi:hypothetical protein